MSLVLILKIIFWTKIILIFLLLGAITKGVTKASFQLEQVDKTRSTHKSIETVEDSSYVHTRVVESGYLYSDDGEDQKKYLATRSVSVANGDAAGTKDPNITLLV